MSGDQLVGVIAIVAMLSLVVTRLANGQTPRRTILRMAGIWLLIGVALAILIWASEFYQF